jgi:hypothetical protein
MRPRLGTARPLPTPQQCSASSRPTEVSPSSALPAERRMTEPRLGKDLGSGLLPFVRAVPRLRPAGDVPDLRGVRAPLQRWRFRTVREGELERGEGPGGDGGAGRGRWPADVRNLRRLGG